MRHMICVGKTRAADGVIISYELEEIGGPAGRQSYGIEYLRTAVEQGEMSISNLHPDPNGPGFLPLGMKPPAPELLGRTPAADKPEKTRRVRKPKRRKRGRR